LWGDRQWQNALNAENINKSFGRNQQKIKNNKREQGTATYWDLTLGNFS
jgi:hypothetical protein